ncbi:MAG: EpsI family protein [Armatimonadetes bacterium]|nr:EpsI family protein [Armatimonadota bacterium]
MSKPAIFSVVCLIMATVALAANRGIAPVESDTLQRLPVEKFPKQVDTWAMVDDRPTDPEVQKAVPTARIVDRIYQDKNGRLINLTLLTATDYADFHDPNICFPGQGFSLTQERHREIAGQPGRYMVAQRQDVRQQVFYWWSGGAAVDTKYGRNQMGRLLALRDRLMGHEGQSLFVRLIADDSVEGQAAMKDFLRNAKAPLADLMAESPKS